MQILFAKTSVSELCDPFARSFEEEELSYNTFTYLLNVEEFEDYILLANFLSKVVFGCLPPNITLAVELVFAEDSEMQLIQLLEEVTSKYTLLELTDIHYGFLPRPKIKCIIALFAEPTKLEPILAYTWPPHYDFGLYMHPVEKFNFQQLQKMIILSRDKRQTWESSKFIQKALQKSGIVFARGCDGDQLNIFSKSIRFNYIAELIKSIAGKNIKVIIKDSLSEED